ncbi:MAG: DNA topoisomerase-1 [Candidatus Saccharimonadales bacterium]
MAKNLVIVESPAKAKTIEKYLGKDFKVLSSVGHVRSIAKKAKNDIPPIDVENGFKTTYEIDSEKKKTVAELRKAVKATETVWLATDEDREGEAIAWHLCEALKLDVKTTKRIVFHEITKTAIEAAVKNPRTVDMHLVEAQQARQILDRIVGFELSPVVWKKVPGGKSAGRVQSPAVRLLVEREREIEGFEGSFQFRVTAVFNPEDSEMKSELDQRFDTEEEAKTYLESLIGAGYTVASVSVSPGTRNPGAPFTTSTLQQEANSKLGFGSKATMSSAQRLYQNGHITYMRTDSVFLSGQSINAAQKFITSKYGEEYSQVRSFKNKNANAQEAHEAIRPSDMSRDLVTGDEYDQKLYSLIRNRTLASQMASAKMERTTVNISTTADSKKFVAKGEVVVFDGFLKVYGSGSKDPDILPSLTEGQSLDLLSAESRQMFARPPARFTEGSLVKKLEELGIGRPSTYATIIGTVQARGYAEKGESEGEPREVIQYTLSGGSVERTLESEKTGSDKGKLVPTPTGKVMSDFLTGHFEKVVDYNFTASVEVDFDRIAEDKLDRNKMLQEFYTPFHKLIESSDDIDRSAVSQTRELGDDPKSGLPIITRFGRFGPMLQMGEATDDEKPRFAPMPKGAKIETVTLEQALEMFKLPRLVGQTDDGKDIKANIGRFGPYVQVEKAFFSIKPHDPMTITLEEAKDIIHVITEKRKPIKLFEKSEIQILNGPYGPYLKKDKVNARIPKDRDLETITEDEAIKMIADAPKKKGKGRFAKKGTKKSTKKKK